jgi:hypothetical protein
MMYREYLVMRKALLWFLAIVVLLQLIGFTSPPKTVQKVDYNDLVANAAMFAAIFAWIFGVALGNASRQPARVLWVLPAERWKLALQVIAVDFAAAIVALVAVSLLGFAAVLLPFMKTQLVGTLSGTDIVFSLVGIFATYGWGALVGMLGRRMPYCGILATPALALWLYIAEQQFAISRIFRAPILANPFAVFNTRLAIMNAQQHHAPLDPVSMSQLWMGTSWETPVLAAIAVATCGLAVILWQRAQVIV